MRLDFRISHRRRWPNGLHWLCCLDDGHLHLLHIHRCLSLHVELTTAGAGLRPDLHVDCHFHLCVRRLCLCVCLHLHLCLDLGLHLHLSLHYHVRFVCDMG